MSIGPNSRSTASAARSTWSASATSVGRIKARPPNRSTSRRAPSRPSRPRASSPMCAPSRAKARAVARPNPADAPVITTTSGLVNCFKLLFPLHVTPLFTPNPLPGQQARHRIFQPLSEARRQRPRAGLPKHVKRAALVEHLVAARAALCAIEAYCYNRISDAQILQRNLRQPLRHVRVNQEHLQGRVRVETEHRLQETEDGGSRPSLRRAGLRVEGREWVIEVALVAAEEFRQAIKVEERGGFKLRLRDQLDDAAVAVAREGDGECSVLDRPHGATMITVPVISPMF